jgi:VIT1/CCC1 family predicted Fe2+/Mn2+ transporter
MLLTALGSNLAWGLTDAVMYLIGTATERRRKSGLLRRLHESRDKGEAHRLITDALPERLAAAAAEDTLEALRKRLVAAPVGSTGLGADDYASALGVFVLVVLATFPVVIPFIFIQESALALRMSNLLALATLFIGGYLLGRLRRRPRVAIGLHHDRGRDCADRNHQGPGWMKARTGSATARLGGVSGRDC